MLSDPLYGAGEAFTKADLWLPTEEVTGFTIIRKQPSYFGLFGAQAFLIDDDLDWPVDNIDDQMSEFANRNLVAAAQVEGLADHAGRLSGFEEAAGRIGYIGEVALGIQIAEVNFVLN